MAEYPPLLETSLAFGLVKFYSGLTVTSRKQPVQGSITESCWNCLRYILDVLQGGVHGGQAI